MKDLDFHIYSLFNINSQLYYNEHISKLNITFHIFDTIHNIKKSLDLYGGIKLRSEKYISMFLIQKTYEIYLKHIEKNILFALLNYAILIKKTLFFFPLDEHESNSFMQLYKNNTKKIKIYVIKISEMQQYILQEKIKHVILKMHHVKNGSISFDTCLKTFMQKINSDISTIYGKNIFTNRF
jgi:hypothetical protein